MSDNELKDVTERKIKKILVMLDGYTEASNMSDLKSEVETLCDMLQDLPLSEAQRFTFSVKKIHNRVKTLTERVKAEAARTEDKLKVMRKTNQANTSYGQFDQKDD